MPNKPSQQIRREQAIDQLIQRLRDHWTKPGFFATITLTVQNGIIGNDVHVAKNEKLGEI
jgi:hypothetical protein